MLPAEEESRLIGSIYDAALDSMLWPDVLEKLRQLGSAEKCNIIFYDRLNRSRNRFFSNGRYSTESYQKYLDEIIDIDIATAMDAMSGSPVGIFRPYDRYRLISQKDDPEYHQYIQQEVQEGPLIATELLRLNHSYCCASLIREIGKPKFSETELTVLNRLGSHLQRAVQTFHSLHTGQRENQNLTAILEASATPLVLIGNSGKVMLANSEARRLLDEHWAITVSRNGCLRATAEDNDLLLQNILRSCGTGKHPAQTSSKPTYLSLSNPKHTHPLKLTIHKLSSDTRLLATFPGASTAVLFIDPERQWSLPFNYLQNAYELTRAELAIAQELVNGASIEQVARNRSTTLETTKGQIKKLLAKMNCPNQIALIQLLITLCADFSQLII